MATKRPFGVTLLMVLIFLMGILAVIGGILVLFTRNDQAYVDAGISSGQVVIYAVVSIVIGVIYLAVAGGLGRGSSLARFLVALVTVLNLIANVWVAIVFAGTARWQAMFGAAIAVLILVLLYNRSSNEFFRSN
ncbi:MAG: hypothetical protein R2737_10185 [Candidatus Nanopelagicales bacterium]